MTKFTKGPWVVREDARVDHGIEYIAGLDIISDNGEIVGCEGIASNSDVNVANAHLIAAAPELYEALDRLVGIVDKGFNLAPNSLAIQNARNALAKARGEA